MRGIVSGVKLKFLRSTWLKIIVTAVLLTILAWQLDLTALGRILATARWSWLLPAILLQLFSTSLTAFRWNRIARSFSINIATTRLIRFSFMGNFFSLFLPSSIGGDFFRAYYLAKASARGMSTTITTTMLDRSGGLCALLLLGSVAAASTRIRVGGINLIWIFAIVVAVYLLANVMLFHSTSHRTINRVLLRFGLGSTVEKLELVFQGLKALLASRGSLVFILFLSLVVQFVSVVIIWLAAQALGIDRPFPVFLVFVPLINLSIMVPLTVNGFGLRESLYLLLFSRLQVEDERAVALSLLQALIMMAAALPGGVLYSLGKKEFPFDPESDGSESAAGSG